MAHLAIGVLVSLLLGTFPMAAWAEHIETIPAGDGCNTCTKQGPGSWTCTLMGCLDANEVADWERKKAAHENEKTGHGAIIDDGPPTLTTPPVLYRCGACPEDVSTGLNKHLSTTAPSYTRHDSTGTEFSNDVRQCLMTLDYQIDPVDGPPFHYTLHDQIDSCLRARGWKP